MSTITAEERALINAAVSDGKVTKVPTGKQTLYDEWIWCKTNKQLVTKKTAENSAGGKSGWHRHQRNKKRQISPAVAKRRMDVRHHILSGKTAQQTADAMDVDKKTVHGDIAWLRENGHAIPSLQSTPRTRRGASENTKKIIEACNENTTAQEVADKMGVSRNSVLCLARKHGAKLKPGLSGFQQRSVKSKELRSKVIGLNDQGKTQRQICAELDIGKSTVFKILKAAGKTNGTRREDELKAQAERREKIPAMLDQGMGTKQIGEALGVAPTTVLKDVKALGLKHKLKINRMSS